MDYSPRERETAVADPVQLDVVDVGGPGRQRRIALGKDDLVEVGPVDDEPRLAVLDRLGKP